MGSENVSITFAELLVAVRDSAPPRLAYRVGEAARALGVSDEYFTMKIAPELRIYRDGRVRLVATAELDRWLREHSAFAVELDARRARGAWRGVSSA